MRGFFGFVLCAACALGQAPSDTARLFDYLGQFRGQAIIELPAADYNSIQDAYLTWIDTRVSSGASIENMTAELKAANLLFNPDADGALTQSRVGFLGEVSVVPVPSSPDLLAIHFEIPSGANCDVDETLVLYTLAPLRRIARINAERSHTHGYLLRSLDAGAAASDVSRIVGTEWVFSNCTSNWNTNIFRINRLQSGILDNILDQPAPDFGVFGAGDVQVRVSGDTVTFDYTTRMRHTQPELRPGIERYRVQDHQLIREPPLASSFGGFIDEWLDLTDDEAVRWSTPEAAARHHDLAEVAKRDSFEWEHASDCTGFPAAREIGVWWTESGRTTVFLITGSSPADLRMLSIQDERSPGCREINRYLDDSSIMEDPSRKRP